MVKIIEAQPSKYPDTSIGESEAISVLEFIICDRNVKPDLKKMDKYPNTDGYLEITENDQTPIGKLEVQVRKLADDKLDPPRCQCELKFLSYCEQPPSLPVLLVGVDTKHTVAYWIHMDRDFLRTLKPKSGAESVSVKIPKENTIRKGSLDYLPKWKEIIHGHLVKLSTYDDVKKEGEALKLLLKKSEPTLGLKKKEFAEIHKFLDFLNTELDSNFRIIKSIFFKDCWKIGLAYFNYAIDEVSYVLYPIPYDTNDVQIRKMSESLRDKFRQQGLTFTGHYTENPISIRAKDYALEIIHSRLRRVFENQLLPIRNIILAREFIFSFVEQFHISLGLEIKDKYSLEEIRSAFFRYLPVWIEESLKNKRISPGRKGFIDPSLVLCQMLDDERKEVAKKVEARLLKGEHSKR
jgi:hypothetical protein